MALTTSSKTQFSFGTTAAATDATSFEADTYTAIGLIESFGNFGDKAEVIKFTSLSDGRVQKLPGVRDAGSFELTCAFDASDAGQTAVRTAFAAANSAVYNVKVELNNALTAGAGPHHGTYFFMKVAVTSAEIEVGSSKDVAKLKMNFEVTSPVIEVPAA